MIQYDFSNHQNRNIRIEDIPPAYFDQICRSAKTDPFYPQWHIAPKCGLINDPNALYCENGIHHIFYQWFPAGPVHGLKHWYHLETKDFIHYKDRGIAMYPDHPFDLYGCYTGMALKDHDKIRIYYTGIQDENSSPCTCYGTIEHNSIENRQKLIDVNPELSTMNFRDPYVWKKDQQYYMLTGAESQDGKGILMFYSGNQPDKFQYNGILDIGSYPFGYMLECPNYFETENRGVLIFSPMGIKSRNKYEFKNVFSVVYMVGDPIKTDLRKFSYKNFYELDKGFDFYAPQTYEDDQHRRIMFGWLGNSKSEYPTDKNNWAHMLTMPRELWIDGEYILQKPLEELKGLRKNKRILQNSQNLTSSSFELECHVEGSFEIILSNEDGDSVSFSGNEEDYCFDRGNMTYVYAEKFGTVRWAKRLEQNQILRIFADRSSLEIFCDNGKTVFTSRIFLSSPSHLSVKGAEGNLYDLIPS